MAERYVVGGYTTLTGRFPDGKKVWVQIPAGIVADYEEKVGHLFKAEVARILLMLCGSEEAVMDKSPAELRELLIGYLARKLAEIAQLTPKMVKSPLEETFESPEMSIQDYNFR
jgi:hypothetical protein